MTAAELIADICNDNHVSVTRILGRDTNKHLTAIRRIIARKLRAWDWSLPMIAKALNRKCHSCAWRWLYFEPRISPSERKRKLSPREQRIEDGAEETLP